MAVERTDKWLKNCNYQPQEVCRKLAPYFKNAKERELLHYLQQNGMYNSTLQGEKDSKQLLEEDVWSKVDKLYRQYKEEWNGPDIPLFIFPFKKQSVFIRSHYKSGLAFPDKLFLFLSPKLDQHQLEALFIHEYHHVCRMSKQEKPIEEYTVGDAIILEGLAEYAVQIIKGAKYLAPWTKQYSTAFLDSYWKSTFHQLLMVQKHERKHDQTIYGRGNFPAMIGYCMGFYLVEQYAKVSNFSTKTSLYLSSEKIIDNYRQKKKQS